jgi:Family of unknown function (DUF6083)
MLHRDSGKTGPCNSCRSTVQQYQIADGRWILLDLHEVPARLVPAERRWLVDLGTAAPAMRPTDMVRTRHTDTCLETASSPRGIDLLLRHRMSFAPHPPEEVPELQSIVATPVRRFVSVREVRDTVACPTCCVAAEFSCLGSNGRAMRSIHEARRAAHDQWLRSRLP